MWKSYNAYGPEIVVLHKMIVATRQKDAPTGQKIALLFDIFWPVGALFLWGPCSAEHAEHA